MQENDRKKVVNTEEQNEPVNPGDRMGEESVTSKDEQVNDSDEKNSNKNEKIERGSEAERPNHIEGDDAAGIDRKIPKL